MSFFDVFRIRTRKPPLLKMESARVRAFEHHSMLCAAEDIAPGITKYTTASHGGYFLNREANAKVPPELQWSTFNMQGLKGWYEEDCDWAIVVYTFQQHFTPELYQHALESLAQHHANALDIINSKTNKS